MAKYDQEHAMKWLEEHPLGYYNNEDDYGEEDPEIAHNESKVLSDEEFWGIVDDWENYGYDKDDNPVHGTIKAACQMVANGYRKRGSKDFQQAILDVELVIQDDLNAYGKKVLRKYFKEADLL